MNKYPAYQAQDIAASSPLRLVVRVYDVAIASCHRGDRSKLRAALTELIAALNFEDGGEIAPRLYRLYEYCMDRSVAGDLDEVRAILEGLREAWRTVAVAEAA